MVSQLIRGMIKTTIRTDILRSHAGDLFNNVENDFLF